ncbi:hypothetical protein ACFPA8_11320 [Streptomyces ovatisporus]|uniref:Uncharacterized protein n=1 Tax=Streptomyces ovatisporus TaxID=1128682 RepID=A0ABV9A704_9ACTN
MPENTSGPAGAAAPGGDPDLAEWIGDVPALVMRLDTWHTPAHFRPDLTADSLRVLEEAVVLTYVPEETEDSRDFLQGAMAYLGEALMHAGGGRWGWSSDGHPVVLPDTELDTGPLDPLRLIIEAQERADFGVFEEAADRVRAEVAARRGREPGWKPVKEATPGLDPWEPEEQHPWLVQWLDARKAGFDAWAAETGSATAVWDFTPASLDLLGRLVISRYGTREKLLDHVDDSFVQGAVWYVGEVAVRHRAGVWEYREAGPDTSPDDPYAGEPFVNQPALRDGGADVPKDALMVALDDGDERALRERLDWYEDPAEAEGSDESDLSREAPVVYRRRG